MRQIFITIILIILFSLTSCSQSGQLGKIDDNEFSENDFTTIVSPNNYLAFKLLEYVEPDDEQNIFISSTSLFMALSMVYNGAEGKAKEEIAKALQLGKIKKEDLNRANASLIDKLTKQTDQIELSLANSIWLNDQYHFQDKFANDNEHYFQAEISEIDITDNESAQIINNWVKENTNEKIKEIVNPPLNEDLVTILINALYFKGDWMYEFDDTLTEDSLFTKSDGKTVTVPLMTSTEEQFPYIENDVFQAISLPYNEGEMSMDIYLPQENITLNELKDEFIGGRWEDWNRQFEEQKGTILLPKFELEYETDLNDTLQELGMDSVFTEDAELTRMIVEDGPIGISKVRQKTYIDVHEQGTEAAAVTSVEIEMMSHVDEQPFYMEVNRPFFFVIKDADTNMILFTGLIEDPSS